jgi:Domain of unknown function (DUF4062)
MADFNRKKLQVFVSSTFTDLIHERQAAVEAILTAGHIPAGMELFTAGDESQMEVIKQWIDESDAYLLILGGRYGKREDLVGWVRPDTQSNLPAIADEIVRLSKENADLRNKLASGPSEEKFKRVAEYRIQLRSTSSAI